jgi:hypothetical protein
MLTVDIYYVQLNWYFGGNNFEKDLERVIIKASLFAKAH